MLSGEKGLFLIQVYRLTSGFSLRQTSHKLELVRTFFRAVETRGAMFGQPICAVHRRIASTIKITSDNINGAITEVLATVVIKFLMGLDGNVVSLGGQVNYKCYTRCFDA